MHGDRLTSAQKWDAAYRAAEAADICADCFAWIPPEAPVRIRWILVHVTKFRFVVTKRLHLPVCLRCARRNYGRAVTRLHPCEGCGRKIGACEPEPLLSGAYLRTCCEACKRLLDLKRSRERRRLVPEPMVCIQCGKTFTPKRADAVTCSNRCRQAQHRRRNGSLTCPEFRTGQPTVTDARSLTTSSGINQPLRQRIGDE
jgi:hypothetical protein